MPTVMNSSILWPSGVRTPSAPYRASVSSAATCTMRRRTTSSESSEARIMPASMSRRSRSPTEVRSGIPGGYPSSGGLVPGLDFWTNEGKRTPIVRAVQRARTRRAERLSAPPYLSTTLFPKGGTRAKEAVMRRLFLTGVFINLAFLIIGLTWIAPIEAHNHRAESAPATTVAPASVTQASVAAAGPVAVALNQWSIAPQASQISAGSVTFAVTNDGTMTHEFVVMRTDTL